MRSLVSLVGAAKLVNFPPLANPPPNPPPNIDPPNTPLLVLPAVPNGDGSGAPEPDEVLLEDIPDPPFAIGPNVSLALGPGFSFVLGLNAEEGAKGVEEEPNAPKGENADFVRAANPETANAVADV